MLKHLLLIILAVPLLFSNCQEVDDWTRYIIGFENNLVIHGPIKTLEATPEEDTTNIVTTPLFKPNYDQKLQEHGDERKKVEKVRMTEFHFNLDEDSAAINLDFLERIEFFMESPGMEDIKIGKVDIVEKGFKQIEVGILFDWEQDMIPYIENGYKIRIEFQANKQIPEDLTFRCACNFQVDTKKFGI